MKKGIIAFGSNFDYKNNHRFWHNVGGSIFDDNIPTKVVDIPYTAGKYHRCPWNWTPPGV